MSKKKSLHLIKSLKSAVRHAELAYRPMACWHLEKTTKLEYTESQKARMLDAAKKYREAKDLVKEVYRELIGTAIVEEET